MNLLLLGAIMLVASIFDLKTGKIPNYLILIGLMVGFISSFVFGGWDGLLTSFTTFAFIFLIFVTTWAFTSIIRFKILGAGDIKLFLVMATFLDFGGTMSIIYYSVIVGGLILMVLVGPRRILEMMKEMLYFFYYLIPGRKPESLKKRTFAPILFVTLLADYAHVFDILFNR